MAEQQTEKEPTKPEIGVESPSRPAATNDRKLTPSQRKLLRALKGNETLQGLRAKRK